MKITNEWTIIFSAIEDAKKTVQNLGGDDIECEVSEDIPTGEDKFVLRTYDFKDTFVSAGFNIYARAKGSGAIVTVSNFNDGGGTGSGGTNYVASFNGRVGNVIPQTGDYTTEMVGLNALIGVPNGIAPLESTGLISSTYLPAYVSSVDTYPTFASLPITGLDDTIYVAEDTNLTYRWSGTQYVEISASLALGTTSQTAYQGDLGAQTTTNLNNHISNTNNPHNVTKAQVGLSEADNTSDMNKPISTATQVELDTKLNIVNALQLGTTTGTALDGFVGTTHINNTLNPHNVTKAQVGLGNVDNTSDLNKPISTLTNLEFDKKPRYQYSLLSVRRATASTAMVNGTPLVMDGTVSRGTLITRPTTTTIMLTAGSAYEVIYSNSYLQTSGSNSAFTITLQTSTDGVTWVNHTVSRAITIRTDNETVEPAIIFKVYESDFTGAHAHLRLMPSSLVGGVNYNVAVEVREV